MSHKKFFISTICILFAVLLLFASITVIIDPFFHYHKPLKCLEYPINNQRYQNDGILKNYDYDAIITGSSMTENFSATQFDELFGTNTVKVPFEGSYLKETGDRIERAFEYNDSIRYVVRSLDFYSLCVDKDHVTDFAYPDYLYDDNIFNDVKYVFNKSVFFKNTVGVLKYNKDNCKTPSFDEAYRWADKFSYGKQHVLERYTRIEKSEQVFENITDAKNTIKANIEQNVVRLAVEHPETEFYLFFPPYSIVTWDSWDRQGLLLYNIEVMRYVSELLVGYDNIHLFSFNDNFDMICNLDNYKDLEHYGDWINRDILENMKNNVGVINSENIDKHFDSLREFYSVYSYDGIFVAE